MKPEKLIFYLFAGLMFFVPLILWPFTSEVFEFNKIVTVYVLTLLISAAWLIRCVIERRIIFRRTILDIPLLLFLGSQIISTILSIDSYTSVFGYYSRFNGGLMSTICYTILYWAFVSNLDRKQTLNAIQFTLLSAILVSIYGVLEHFGIDKDLWVQDVQSRVFSTLGQPNWLAAWVVALIPVTWALMFNAKKLNARFLHLTISVLFFVTLLFTKSRSGLVGFLVADVIFWGLILLTKFKENLKQFVICNLLFVILALVIGTQFTPSLRQILNIPVKNPVPMAQGTVLENGGTESGEIRKIVWQGAIDIWKHYPIFGTGAETFAYSYYSFRPVAHNITSEWDFIYNKAHNEFLNFAANSGTVGLLSYLVVIIFTIIQITNFKLQITNENSEFKIYNYAFLAGFISLSVSNFFGFSVVPNQLLFFLFPAFASALAINDRPQEQKNGINTIGIQKIGIGIILLFTSYFLLLTYRYWYSDILYAKAKAQNSLLRPDLAIPLLNRTISFVPNQAIYHSELAISYSSVAMAYNQENDSTSSAYFTDLTINNITNALRLAPANINIIRQMFGVYVRLSTIDEKYLVTARNVLISAINLAPTDPKLYYNLGIADANLGDQENAILSFKKSIELKPNYADARIQYAALLVHTNEIEEAKKQLKYILTNIDPGNTTAKTALDNLN